MNTCPIAYIPCGAERYSREGLRLLDPKLTRLQDFPHDAAEQRREATLRVGRMSIAGVQPKLSVVLDVAEGLFQLVDHGGRFIIKPQHAVFPEMAENEGLTMHLADLAGIEVPVSGLMRCLDGSWSYFVKRFDRAGRGRKIALEDFAQLSNESRETKYDVSMEGVVKVLDQYSTFPLVDRSTLLRLALFSFLVGNEDLHLKNLSLITDGLRHRLSPAYDLLSSTVAYRQLGQPHDRIEELALSLNGKKRRLTRKDLIDYFGRERLELPGKVIDGILETFTKAIPRWKQRIDVSFLSATGRQLYHELLAERASRLGLLA